MNSYKDIEDNLFSDALAFTSAEEKIEHEAHMISFRFLSELSRLMEENEPLINKKELAKRMGTSSSYITQLFQGDKLLNFLSVAKIQEIFGVTFEIKALRNEAQREDQIMNHLRELYKNDYNGFWVSKNEDFIQNDYKGASLEITGSFDEISINSNLKTA